MPASFHADSHPCRGRCRNLEGVRRGLIEDRALQPRTSNSLASSYRAGANDDSIRMRFPCHRSLAQEPHFISPLKYPPAPTQPCDFQLAFGCGGAGKPILQQAVRSTRTYHGSISVAHIPSGDRAKCFADFIDKRRDALPLRMGGDHDRGLVVNPLQRSGPMNQSIRSRLRRFGSQFREE